MNLEMKKVKKIMPLMFSTFFVAIASIIYELIIGGISSYLLGNSVYQFSLTIGFFMTAMGIGALISKYISKTLLTKFILIEILLGVIGGFTAISLFVSFAITNSYQLIMYLLILVIGALTGLEIPLLTRLIQKNNSIKVALANVLSVDYLGGLAGSILFPIILLPTLGFILTSYLMGLLNLVVALIIYLKYKEQIKEQRLVLVVLLLAIATVGLGIIKADKMEHYLERRLYRDQVVYSKQSKYQKIVITKDDQDLRLFLNGNIQFSSQDEYRYHESLVHPVMSLVDQPQHILILGGGNGLVIKQLLKYNNLEQIDLVDLDQAVTTLAQENKYLLKVNNNSLEDKRVKIYNQDAYQFLRSSKQKYDVIISDLPDPNNESLNKLYTTTFYNLVYNHLKDQGGFVVQSTSSYFAPQSFWIIHHTINSSQFEEAIPYHCYVPSFGDWGFNLALKGKKNKFARANLDITVETKYLSEENIISLFSFAKDVLRWKNKVNKNILFKPILIDHYYHEWKTY